MREALLCLLAVNVTLVLTPLLIEFPLIKQTPRLLAIAYTVRNLSPAVSAIAAVVAAALWLWTRGQLWLPALIVGFAVISRVNVSEWVFAPARAGETIEIAQFHDIRDGDMVIGVKLGALSRAYPVRWLAYHHLLNDRLGAISVLPTYCALCHTGLVWDRAVDGRILSFHLGGVNHQNMLMIDEETGSWWQQVTGECLLGPLKGTKLRRIPSDEVSLAVWREERPESSVVRFNPRYAFLYFSSDWERKIARVPAPSSSGQIGPRELVVGIAVDGAAVAYPLAALRERSPINTQVGTVPVLLIVAPDGNSVRSFVRPHAAGEILEFFRRTEDGNLMDGTTGSIWSFSGQALSGPLMGQSLDALQNTKDFWFDWHHHHLGGALQIRGF